MKITKEYLLETKAKLEKMIEYLAARWEDEHEYEDFNEYKKHVETNMPKGLKLLEMNKRPFGIKFNVVGTKIRAHMFVEGDYIVTKNIA